MMRFATIKQIEIIGEASNHLSETLKTKLPEISWPQVIGMRHILVHEYFGIDTDLIWQVIIDELPELKSNLMPIVNTL